MKKYDFLATCSTCKFSKTCKYKIDMEKLAKIFSDNFEPNYRLIEYLPITKLSLLCDYWQMDNSNEENQNE